MLSPFIRGARAFRQFRQNNANFGLPALLGGTGTRQAGAPCAQEQARQLLAGFASGLGGGGGGLDALTRAIGSGGGGSPATDLITSAGLNALGEFVYCVTS